MDERCVAAGALIGGGYPRMANISEGTMERMIAPEEFAKLKAENEEREKRHRKETVARAVLEMAERLVMRGKSPEQALGIATDFITRANETLNTFSLPE